MFYSKIKRIIYLNKKGRPLKMKRLILFLMLILSVSIVSAQENRDILDIKKTIEGYLTGNNLYDIDSAMQSFSINYSDIKGENIRDYVKFKSDLKDYLNDISKKYTDYNRSDLEIIKSDIQDDKAILDIEYNWKRFNLDTLQEENGKKKRQVSLVKENGVWKITQWKELREP